jgi:hypothetical protein
MKCHHRDRDEAARIAPRTGLLAYGGDFAEGWRLAASYVHKI